MRILHISNRKKELRNRITVKYLIYVFAFTAIANEDKVDEQHRSYSYNQARGAARREGWIAFAYFYG